MTVRTYGCTPYRVVVVHGGPGAPGEMAPVARELSKHFGVLEPLQTATSLEGQVAELIKQIQNNCATPVTVVGYSWGAWLACIVAARQPEIVQKLILISSGPFEDRFVETLKQTRRSRLSSDEREEIESLAKKFARLDDASLSRLGELTKKTDLLDPMDVPSEILKCDSDSFKNVWPEAAALRSSGELLALAKKIKCPVTAIHGDFDPHPADGVKLPLQANLSKFKFFELEHCGHTPWVERQARDKFFRTLVEEAGTF